MSTVPAAKERLSMILAILAVLVLGWTSFFVTDRAAAAFTDRANMTLSEMGKPNFSVGVIDDDNRVWPDQNVRVGRGLRNVLEPGSTGNTPLKIFNNTPSLSSAIRLSIGFSDVGYPYYPMRKHILLTVIDAQTRHVYLGDASGDPTKGASLMETYDLDFGVITPRGLPPQNKGEEYVPGAPGSLRDLELIFHFPETDEFVPPGAMRSHLSITTTPIIE